MTRWLRFLLPAAVALAAASPAFADIYIHLKDGKVLVVPVDPKDLDYIELNRKNGPRPQGAETVPPQYDRQYEGPPPQAEGQ